MIAQVPYVVAPTKTLNQSVSLNYAPLANRGSLSYPVSGVPTSVLNPRWSAYVGLSVDGQAGTVGGNVGVNINW
ncbi:hypothetical protein [Deinococcus aluminii]|uniref:hypothetical protein n=1 Tax=Deinococcus aluminii TaxID=1656885 RepID=UPI0031EDC916